MLELEQLREALASAKQIEAALTQRLREQELVLSGLQAVMNADNPAILMTLTFDLLREAVGFDAALVLRAEQGRFVCTDATDAEAIGQSWPDGGFLRRVADGRRSEEHTSELQSLMRTSYAVFCLKKKTTSITHHDHITEDSK